jgi:hypothetical protein
MNSTMQMMEAHFKETPMPGMDLTAMQECIEASAACEQACTMCADSMMGNEMAMARGLCATTADLAGTMMRAMLRPNGMHSEGMLALHRASVTMANACAEECMKHAGMSEDARLCAEACRQNAMACQAMIDAMADTTPRS